MRTKRRKVGDKLTKEQLYLAKREAHAFWGCAYNLYKLVVTSPQEMGNWVYNPLESFYERDAIWGRDGIKFPLEDLYAICVNVGFSLELLLKCLLYHDRNEIVKEHLNTHDLYKIYSAMSLTLRKKITEAYCKALAQSTEGDLEFATKRLTTEYPTLDAELPKSYYDKTDTIDAMLKFIDKHDLLYGKRYDCFSYDQGDWNIFLVKLEGLFIFAENLTRVRKSSNGEWIILK